jgi:hypothetical protein
MKRHFMTSTHFRHFLDVYTCHETLHEYLENEFQEWIDNEFERDMVVIIGRLGTSELASATHGCSLKRNWVISNYITSCCSFLISIAHNFISETLPDCALEFISKEQDLVLARSDYLRRLTKSVVCKHLTTLVETQVRLSHLRQHDIKRFNERLVFLTESRNNSASVECAKDALSPNSELGVVTDNSNVVVFPRQH